MLYKYLSVDGLEKSISENTIRFSNLNEWRRGSSNDCSENYLASCLEKIEDFKSLMIDFDKMGFDDEQKRKHLYYIGLCSYQIYACSFCESLDNSEHMWNEFCKEGGACIVYDDSLYDYLLFKYSKVHDAIKGEEGTNVYTIRKGKVAYFDSLPSLESVIRKMENSFPDAFLQSAYFSKIKKYNDKNYELEKEVRFTAHRYETFVTAVSLSLSNRFDNYAFSFDDLGKWFMRKYLIDMDEAESIYMKIEMDKLIKEVIISPTSCEEQIEKMKYICDKCDLKIVAV